VIPEDLRKETERRYKRPEPNERNLFNVNLTPYSELYSPKEELLRMLKIMELRINGMIKNPKSNNNTIVKNWGISDSERVYLGIKYS
jgi:hypothetical protein